MTYIYEIPFVDYQKTMIDRISLELFLDQFFFFPS